jgi:hypothetical protein
MARHFEQDGTTMATSTDGFLYYLQLQGYVKADKTTMRFDLQAADHAAAVTAAGLIKAAVIALTGAFVRQSYITTIIDDVDNSRPTDDAANVFEEALLVVHTIDGTQEETATVRIPAPVETLFLSDGSTVSSSNLLASGLLAVLAANMYISDGEQINTALDNGFIKGNKISKAKKLKNT